MNPPIRIAVTGAAGRMGQEVVRAVHEAQEMELVLAVDIRHMGKDAGRVAGIDSLNLPICSDLFEGLRETKPDVLVDFTVAETAVRNIEIALEQGIYVVVGTTGIAPNEVQRLGERAERQGVALLIAPNFSIGAVLMMRFAQEAARFFPQVEIIELHHDGKLDAPSGTALRTADLLASARGETVDAPRSGKIQVEGARGADVKGVHVHSVRLPGLVAHQEVLFGGLGEILTIRHDSTSRQCFMPGVLLAIRKVRELRGLVVGLEAILF